MKNLLARLRDITHVQLAVLLTALAVALLLTCFFVGSATVICTDPSMEESVKVLRKYRNSERAKLLARAKEQPAFRTELIRCLTELINSYEEDYKGDSEIRALRDLDAVEALPLLRARWDKIAKKVHYLESGDPRIQLLLTIAQLLPETESLQFLVETEADKQEAPKVRFRATILLCASGSERGIQHVLSAYEQARKKYPMTVRMSLEEQTQYPRAREDWDKDMDMMRDSSERSMLLEDSNGDTDGDGVLDGNDRNPLCAPKEGDAEVAGIAAFLFYLHTTYARERHGLWIARTVDIYDGLVRPSIFDGVELTGVDALVLHMSEDGIKKYRAIHGYGTPIINIHELNDTQKRLYTKLLEEEGSTDESLRTFSFSEDVAPLAGASWLIRVRRVHGVWLPVYWEMTGIS